MLSPKIEAINYFDNLIQRVDIDIEESIEKYNEEQTIGELNFRTSKNPFQLLYFYSKSTEELITCENLLPESTKVVDYLKQIRMRTIEELRKEQNDTLDNLKLNSIDLDSINGNKKPQEEKIDELRSKLFKDKFPFQMLYKPPKQQWIFNLYTIITDFYISQSDIFILE